MTAPIITRPLVERYLRATGWTEQQRTWTKGASRFFGFTAEHGPPLSAFAAAEGMSESDLSVRLGLCAAAEAAFAVVDQPGHASPEQRAALADFADELLRRAGVDPERWATAGKEGA